jgi:RNA polymerase sigma factor (sigma-70 family)
MSAVAARNPRSPRIVALSRLGDEALAGRAAAGSGAAFSALYERYHGPLLGFCRSILLDDHDAHDATQNALEAALRSLPRREPGRPLRPWLYRIAHNEAIDIVRRRRPQAELTELDAPTVPGPEVDAEQRVRLAQLVDDLRGLPERQRGALVMRELSGLGYDEIAVALGVSPGAARRAVFDARSSLHEAVDGRATECTSVRHCISDGDRRSMRARRIRAHLRSCDDCASFQHSIGARSADLHLLGPLLPGAALAGMLGGGAGGGGALAALGGGGAATVTVAGWSAIPVLVKGLTVAAVVATTGTAAVEMQRSPRAEEPAPRTQAARAAQAAGSPARALLPRPGAARAGSPARAGSTRGKPTPQAAVGRLTGARGKATAPGATRPTTATTVPAAAPAPPATAQHAPAPTTPARPAANPPQRAIDRLTDVREQVVAALAQAQAIAGAGTSGALERARATLHTTLGSLGTTIDRVLESAGLAPLGTTAAPPPSATSSPSTALVAPAQQVLDEVDAVLSRLFARR